MSVVLELPPELESELAQEAAKAGVPFSEYLVRLLRSLRPPAPRTGAPRTGAELLAYLEKEGVIGSRSDIADSSAHARALRERAERR